LRGGEAEEKKEKVPFPNQESEKGDFHSVAIDKVKETGEIRKGKEKKNGKRFHHLQLGQPHKIPSFDLSRKKKKEKD